LKHKLEQEGPLDPIDAARLVKQIAEAIEHVHTKTSKKGKGTVVHRDLKPGNIQGERIKIHPNCRVEVDSDK